MKKNKTITLTNKAFKLEVFWNGSVVAMQSGLFIGLIALFLFAQNDAVNKLCVVAFIVDIIAILFVLITSTSIDVSDGTENNDDSVKKESINIKVERKPAKDSGKEKPASNSSNAIIKNKVPIPNPTNKPQSTNEDKQSNVTNSSPTLKPIDEMDSSDWENLFHM